MARSEQPDVIDNITSNLKAEKKESFTEPDQLEGKAVVKYAIKPDKPVRHTTFSEPIHYPFELVNFARLSNRDLHTINIKQETGVYLGITLSTFYEDPAQTGATRNYTIN